MKSLWCLVLTLSVFAEDYPYRFEGYFENFIHKKLELVAKFLPYNPIIIEAGAFEGKTTVQLATFWPKGQIFAFEPLPNRYNILQQNISSFPHITSLPMGISHRSGEALLYVCHGTEGISPIFEMSSSLLPPTSQMEIHYKGPVLQIPCVTLQEFCEQNKISYVDLLWLELEGMELATLQHSPQITKTVKIIYTKTYFYPFREGITFYPELKAFLEEIGFKLFSHWYFEGLCGDAIFVKEDIFHAVLGVY